MERIKLWYYNHKTWVYNTQYILYSIILLTVVMLIDLRYYQVQQYIPKVFFTSVSLAKTILAALAGAQLTITTFTFSSILTVMSNYVSNFSPRVTDYFVEEKITMKVLGIFFGGFFYSITALVFMRDALEDQMVVAGFVGVVYAIVSMVYFIIFVQKVIISSKSENLIAKIYDETLKVIKKELDHREEYQGIFIDKQDTHTINLYPNKNGYLSAIDYTKIARLLGEGHCELIVDSKIGDYVNSERPLAHMNQVKDVEFDKELMENLAETFHLTENKVHENDYRNGLDKLEEIAIKALSPGINDPNTAIHCIQKISLLLTYLSKTANHHIIVKGSEEVKISYTAFTFPEDLYYSFNQIIHYGKEDVDVMVAVFEALETLYYSALPQFKDDIWNFAKDIRENIMPPVKGNYNKERLEVIYQRIREED